METSKAESSSLGSLRKETILALSLKKQVRKGITGSPHGICRVQWGNSAISQ